MVRITVQLVRNKAEHHDRELAPLEEIALHQENIEKIEYIQDWCPKLRILLFQSNLIAKIENLHKLKYLEYLNLALNNIEKIENLERCESLQKLDLTINFIGDIVSIESLVNNYNLENLYLTGNPCTDYDNYRDFVIGTLPQLKYLDGVDIDRSDRIKALQNLPVIRADIIFEQKTYMGQRTKQKARLERDIKEKWETEYSTLDPEERNKKFYSEKCEHAPEVRYEMEQMRQLKLKESETVDKQKEEPRVIKFFAPDGRPYNINQAKIDFLFDDSENDKFVLDLAIYKYLDTNLLDIDIQPTYVRVTVKYKVFQIHLPEEIDMANSTAQRSQTTGHLVITMPKLNFVTVKPLIKKSPDLKSQVYSENNENDCHTGSGQTKREYLEIGSEHQALDLTKMSQPSSNKKYSYPEFNIGEKAPGPDFEDNPEVPPLC